MFHSPSVIKEFCYTSLWTHVVSADVDGPSTIDRIHDSLELCWSFPPTPKSSSTIPLILHLDRDFECVDPFYFSLISMTSSKLLKTLI
jgi:hypothetical protein